MDPNDKWEHSVRESNYAEWLNRALAYREAMERAGVFGLSLLRICQECYVRDITVKRFGTVWLCSKCREKLIHTH